MARSDYWLKLAGTAIAALGVVGALGGGTLAYFDYRRKAELQAMRGLHEAQLATCQDVSASAARLFSASSQTDFRMSLTAFAELKHGRALAILDKSVLDAMVRVYNVAISIDSPNKGSTFRKEVRATLCDEPFKIVLECRKMLARGFRMEGGTSIELLADDYPMRWAPDSCAIGGSARK